MRYCDECAFLYSEGYEYPEYYCSVGINEDDPMFVEDDKGCGCKYNLRTIRKKQKRLAEAEYWRDIGLIDFGLMSTIEYTKENCDLLEICRELIRHSIGMDNRDTYIRHGKKFYKPYRNYFQTGIECHDYPIWEKMVKAGLAEQTKKDEHGNAWYRITRLGLDWLGAHDGVHIHDERY